MPGVSKIIARLSSIYFGRVSGQFFSSTVCLAAYAELLYFFQDSNSSIPDKLMYAVHLNFTKGWQEASFLS